MGEHPRFAPKQSQLSSKPMALNGQCTSPTMRYDSPDFRNTPVVGLSNPPESANMSIGGKRTRESKSTGDHAVQARFKKRRQTLYTAENNSHDVAADPVEASKNSQTRGVRKSCDNLHNIRSSDSLDDLPEQRNSVRRSARIAEQRAKG